MSSLTDRVPLGPFDVESSDSVFRRLLLRAAVLLGLGCAVLVWSVVAIVVSVGFVVAVAMLTTLATLRQDADRGRQATIRVGWLTGKITLTVVAAVAVADLAGLSGVLLVAVCALLADGVRDRVLHLGDHVLRRPPLGTA